MFHLQRLIEEYKPSNDDPNVARTKAIKSYAKLLDDGEVDLENVSLREMLEACINDGRRLRNDELGTERIVNSIGYEDFITACTKTVEAKVKKEYATGIGEAMKLVSKEPSDVAYEGKQIQWPDAKGLLRKHPGTPYRGGFIGRGENVLSYYNFGYGVVEDVEWEVIRFDRTGDLMNFLGRQLGKNIGALQHELIIKTIEDADRAAIFDEADPGRFIWNGTKQTVYADDHSSWYGQTNDNLGTADFTGNGTARVQEAWKLLHSMKNQENQPILGNDAKLILACVDDYLEAVQVMKSPVEVAANMGHATSAIAKLYGVVKSEYLTAGVNYIGNFTEGVRVKEVEPYKVERITGKGSREMFVRNLVATFRASFYWGVYLNSPFHIIKFAAS